jgi:type III secretory pathway component EscS
MDALQNGVEWILIYVVFRGIVARWMGDEIRQFIIQPLLRFLYKWLGQPLLRYAQKKFHADYHAIWTHYVLRRKGYGHGRKLAECNDGGCATIG